MNSTGEKRKIRIATTYAISAYLLNKHLLTYKQLNPDITFEVIANDQEIDLTLSDADFVISVYKLDAKGIEQEHLHTMKKKLFASENYIKNYGEPFKVKDLNKHQVIAFKSEKVLPHADVEWILRLGMPSGELRESDFSSNSFESLVFTAAADGGILSSYEEFSIIREAKLEHILTYLEGPATSIHICYHHYAKDDHQLMNFKDYLMPRFGKEHI